MTVYPATYRKRLYAGGGGLTASEIAILGTLAFLAEHAREGGWVAVDQEELGMRCRVTPRHIRRLLPELQQRGWIKIRTGVRNGHYQSSEYRLTIPPPDTMSPGPEDTMSPTTGHHVLLQADIAPLTTEDTMSEQRLRSKSLRTVTTTRITAAEESTSTPKPQTEAAEPARPPMADGPGDWRNLPPRDPNTTQHLDQLGIRRRKHHA